MHSIPRAGAVRDKGVQSLSAIVAAFPSRSASLIAVSGRHKSKPVSYFVPQAIIEASAIAIETKAYNRAFSSSDNSLYCDTIPVKVNNWPGGLEVPSKSLAQKNPIS